MAVEPLAKGLGTTKGSFYWHFADRNALLEATLGLWERRDTDQVIAAVDEARDAVTRLRHLLRLTFTSVVWADSITSTSSSRSVPDRSAIAASGWAARSRSMT